MRESFFGQPDLEEHLIDIALDNITLDNMRKYKPKTKYKRHLFKKLNILFPSKKPADEDLGKKPQPFKFTICIEGNIGSGKSRLLNYFSSNPSIVTIPEPIEKWCNESNINFLKEMYENPTNNSFEFQLLAQLDLFKMHGKPTPATAKIKMQERSLQSQFSVFIPQMREDGYLTDKQTTLLNAYYNYLERHEDLSIDMYIFIKTSPENCLRRIKTRNRSGEENITLELLKKLDSHYNNWLETTEIASKTIIINGDVDPSEMSTQYQILEFSINR